ncbi:MAG: hypothetical protein JXR89_11810, partial [Deltaproteobacteria bacterium]|nr:hypothetical protein [Deltaproteobacteria bacterium]
NYEISKLVSRTVMPVGAVKKISVAVMVDGKYENGADKGKNYVPRSEAELLVYTSMIKKAIGFNQKRGDQVEVANLAFDNESLKTEVEELKKANLYSMIYQGLKYFAIALAALFFYFKILKPAWRGVTGGLGSRPAGAMAAGKGLGKLADDISEKVEISRHETVMDQVAEFASKSPEEVAKVVKLWLKGQAV